MKLDAQNRTIVVMLFFLTSVSMTGFAQGKVAVGRTVQCMAQWTRELNDNIHNSRYRVHIVLTMLFGSWYRLYIPQLQRDEKPYGNTEPVCPIFLLLERTSTFVCGFHCRFRYQ